MLDALSHIIGVVLDACVRPGNRYVWLGVLLVVITIAVAARCALHQPGD